MMVSPAALLTWGIAALATAGVVTRPFRWPEAIWAGAGAILLVALGLLPAGEALGAVGRGLDVYLFLIGMMLLSETARREGLFDAAAALAVNLAGGSTRRLLALVYAVGVVVTIFLSNDATAVVLTPAVFAAARKAKADPDPLLFSCAFVANAASFVLPISNPANLVLYDGHTPPLAAWTSRFALASILSIVATYAALRIAERRRLAGACAASVEQPRLTASGWTALIGLAATAAGLLAVSALGLPLGLPTCILGAATMLVVLVRDRALPWPVLKEVSWSVIPLVAGLFVLVEGLAHTGVISALATLLRQAGERHVQGAAAAAGGLVAVASNLMNNLPAGLIASSTVRQAHAPLAVVDSLLIGMDLGPNLSITGSLATILWLAAIRREGEAVSFWRFLKVGAVVAPPALLAALAARLLA
ncbi:MAG: arsenic transporter [Caulobacteraceae bacterium]|nr:arsenic transporter [Caulobacteraceae bacterium]